MSEEEETVPNENSQVLIGETVKVVKVTKPPESETGEGEEGSPTVMIYDGG